MLVLTRKHREKIVIELNGDQIIIDVLNIGDGRVRLGVVAPQHITVHRQEVYDRIQQEGSNRLEDERTNAAR
jgi:carbon storage regulator